MSAPNDGDQAIGNTTIMPRSRGVPCLWDGEEQRGVVGWDGVSRMVPLDDDAIEQRWKAEHAHIMALPKPKTPDKQIAELKQRIAALQAKQAAKS